MPNKKKNSSIEAIEIPKSKLQTLKKTPQTESKNDTINYSTGAFGGVKKFIFTTMDRVAVVIIGKDDVAGYEPPFGIASDGTGDIVRRNFKKGTVIIRDHLSRIQFELPAHKVRRPQFS